MNQVVHILIVGLLVLGSSSDVATVSHEKRNAEILGLENSKPNMEQLERKQRSERVLESENVPFNKFLPVIPSSDHVQIRSEGEVELRALCLFVVALKGEGLEQEGIQELVSNYDLSEYFTPDELAFVNNPNPSHNDRIQFAWRYESAWTMLWALGFVDSFDRPDQIVDAEKLVRLVYSYSTESFQSVGNLRNAAELLDQADLVYRYHWAITSARLNGVEAPGGLDRGVVFERHYSLNWLIGYMGQAWDDVSTDT